MYDVCMKNNEIEKLKRQLSDLNYEGRSMWRTGDEIERIEKDMQKIADKLRKKHKLEDWEIY